MTKTTIVAWNHDTDTEVLQKKAENYFYIPLTFANTDVLRSLGAAISDALMAGPETKPISGSLAQGAHPPVALGN